MKSWTKLLSILVLALTLVGALNAQNTTAYNTFARSGYMNYGGAAITSANPITLTTSATKYSDSLKVDGANKIVFDVTLAAGQTDTHTVTVQVSPDGVTWATCVALTAEVGPTATQVLNEVLTFTASSVSKRLTVVGVPPCQYVRLKFTAGSAAYPALSFYPVFYTYSFDGQIGNVRPIVTQKAKKNGVIIDSTNYLSVAGGAAGYTDGIKINDANVVGVVANMISSTSSATTHAAKIQVSPDNVNWYDPVPEGSDQYIYKTIGSWGATANTCKAFIVSGFFPAKYIRFYWASQAAKDVTLGPIFVITY